MATWISGIRYHDKSLTSPDTVARALQNSLPAAPGKKYSNAMSYLVPASRAKGQPAKAKLELAKTALRNIAFVGLVEAWPTTIALVRSALDPDLASPTMWRKALRVEKNSAKHKFSGQDVISRLHPDIFHKAVQYLEAEIYSTPTPSELTTSPASTSLTIFLLLLVILLPPPRWSPPVVAPSRPRRPSLPISTPPSIVLTSFLRTCGPPFWRRLLRPLL